jgi:hypothetical protein
VTTVRSRRPMDRISKEELSMIRTALVFLSCLVPAAVANAQLEAPVWYVQYEVTMKADHTASDSRGITTASKLNTSFSSSAVLDMRNPGQVLSMDYSGMDAEKMKNMTVAEQMKISQQMMEAMQYTANWMRGPRDVGSESDAMMKQMLSETVPIEISFERITTGNNLPDETGGRYDSYHQTTASASGGSLYTHNDQVKFEINTASKKYWLMLPHAGQDLNTAANDLKWVDVTKTRKTGATAWENEDRKTRETAIDFGNGFKLDPQPGGGESMLIVGTLDPSGKISGEKSFTGRLGVTGADVPVTVTYQYTVTQTPPAKKTK